jgi:integrase
MTAYRHGLRASELIALRWDQIDLKAGTLHVARLKHGSPSTHPLRRPELRALRAWKRAQGDATPYVFTSLLGGPMTRRTGSITSLPKGRKPRASSFQFTRTCCATRPGFISLTPARIRARFSSISATRIFSTRCDIRSWRPTGSKTSGRTDQSEFAVRRRVSRKN